MSTLTVTDRRAFAVKGKLGAGFHVSIQIYKTRLGLGLFAYEPKTRIRSGDLPRPNTGGNLELGVGGSGDVYYRGARASLELFLWEPKIKVWNNGWPKR